jgi:hypothetical protein
MLKRLAASLLVALFAKPAFSEYVVNQIDYIDPATGAVASSTELWSSNKSANTLGNASVDGVNFFSFLYDPASGEYQRIPLPPGFDGISTFVSPTGINDAGVIVGSTFEPAEPGEDGEPRFSSRGFILKDGVYSFFTAPRWANTNARTIANPTPAHPDGLVAGYVDDAIFDTPRSWRGIVHDPVTSGFMTIDTVDGFAVLPHGQNASGHIVGSIIGFGGTFGDDGFLAPGQWGFLFTPATAGDPMQGGSVSYFRINNAGHVVPPGEDGLRTFARGLNDHGVMALAVQTPIPGSRKTDTHVGNAAAGFQRINAPGGNDGPRCENFAFRGLFPEHLNNAGQVFGEFIDGACNQHGFIATPASLPTGTTSTGAHRYSVDVSANAPVFISAPTGLGYLYVAGWRDPAFASVRLPLGFGDNKFVVVAGLRAFAVNAGQLFDFRAHGFEKGVRAFAVACIDPAARLHPVNSLAFPTELTFVGAGIFTGVQQPFLDLTERGFPPPSSADCRRSLLSLR